MRKRTLSIILLLLITLSFSLCSSAFSTSTFSILFIDVGQGDAALVECDGRYMLIDGGNKHAGNKVHEVLKERGVRRLDILAISHIHADHIGGLPKALEDISKIKKTIANQKEGKSEVFTDLEKELRKCSAKITVPRVNKKYKLGSAKVKVVDVSSTSGNDSLVLMVTYGKTKFLFTGDIEDKAQKRISEKYKNEKDKPYKIDLIKMPHHGSGSSKSVKGTGSLYQFIRTFMPKYAVISVGEGNGHRHPREETLSLLEDAEVKVYRTDINGNIFVQSDGKKISVKCEK